MNFLNYFSTVLPLTFSPGEARSTHDPNSPSRHYQLLSIERPMPFVLCDKHVRCTYVIGSLYECAPAGYGLGLALGCDFCFIEPTDLAVYFLNEH